MDRNWRKAAAIPITALLSGVLLVSFLWSREPCYGDKPLSYWLEQLRGPESQQAQEAMHSMGAEGVPVLLRKIRNEHSFRQRCYRTLWPRIPAAWQRRLTPPKPLPTYGVPHSQIVSALQMLDASAVPSLIGALEDPNSDVQVTVMAALSSFGEQAGAAIPHLSKLVKHQNGYVRRWAVYTLGRMGPERKTAIPALVAALHDSEDSPLPGSPARVRETAALVLGEIGPEAQQAGPELKKLLSDADSVVRQQAAIALWRISQDRDVLPVLIAELEKARDSGSQKTLIAALAEMGPAARSAVPAIRNILDPKGVRWSAVRVVQRAPSTNQVAGPPTLADTAREALRRIDPDGAGKVRSELFDDPVRLRW